ncbi:MAG TPA: hypothetical protein P5295_17800 [Spirochaetota bacterium]|nr:hypothetical protein [Spirochaetota bacterium]
MKMIATQQHYMMKFAGLVSAFFISAVLWAAIIAAVRFFCR